MEGRGDDSDNWFDEPDVSDAWEARSERVARARAAGPPERDDDSDDWLTPTAPEPRARRERSLPNRRQVAAGGAAALVIALLLGVLAAAGVFSSNGKPASLATTTTQTVTKPAVTTTPVTKPKPSVPVPTTGLKPGDKGAAVKLLQRALTRAGYSAGKADGSYGPSTESAVKQFQTANHLTADGIAGSKTLAALKAALS